MRSCSLYANNNAKAAQNLYVTQAFQPWHKHTNKILRIRKVDRSHSINDVHYFVPIHQKPYWFSWHVILRWNSRIACISNKWEVSDNQVYLVTVKKLLNHCTINVNHKYGVDWSDAKTWRVRWRACLCLCLYGGICRSVFFNCACCCVNVSVLASQMW